MDEKRAQELIEKIKQGVTEEVKKEIEKELKENIIPQFTKGVDNKKKASETFRDIIKALWNNDWGQVKSLTETDEGGAFIPTEVSKEVARLMGQVGLVRKAGARVFSLNNPTKVPVFSGATLGSFTTEGATLTAVSDTLFSEVDFKLHKYISIIPMSVELLEDAPGLVDLLTVLVAEDLAAREDYACLMFDTASGDPWDGIIKVADNVYTLTGDITDGTWEDLVKLRDAAPYQVKYSGAYFMHPSVWSFYQSFKDSTNRPIFDLEKNTFAGRPVFEVPFLPAKGSTSGGKAVVVYGDFKYLWIGEKGGLSLEVMREATIGSTKLGEKDFRALKFRKREGAVVVKTDAFAVMKTAA